MKEEDASNKTATEPRLERGWRTGADRIPIEDVQKEWRAAAESMCPVAGGCGHYPRCDCGQGPGGTDAWIAGGTDLDGMRHAAAEDDSHGHHLQANYLRQGADEIEWLRTRVKELKDAR